MRTFRPFAAWAFTVACVIVSLVELHRSFGLHVAPPTYTEKVNGVTYLLVPLWLIGAYAIHRAREWAVWFAWCACFASLIHGVVLLAGSWIAWGTFYAGWGLLLFALFFQVHPPRISEVAPGSETARQPGQTAA